jgi:hypothetical protein
MAECVSAVHRVYIFAVYHGVHLSKGSVGESDVQVTDDVEVLRDAQIPTTVIIIDQPYIKLSFKVSLDLLTMTIYSELN